LYDETNVWLKAIKARGGKFLGGQKPNLADLAVFGALSAIEGCEAFSDLCANTKIKTWYELVKKSVKNSEGQLLLAER
jgi:microsomal prostaglandin-E synthase 2